MDIIIYKAGYLKVHAFFRKVFPMHGNDIALRFSRHQVLCPSAMIILCINSFVSLLARLLG